MLQQLVSTGVPLVTAYPRAEVLPDHLHAAAAAALDAPETPSGAGVHDLREALAGVMGLTTPEAVTVTTGAMHALNVIWMALAGDGGRVVVPTPTYFVDGSIRLAGLTPMPVAAVHAVGWDWERIAVAVDADTRGVFLTNPNNPTGACFTPDDLAELTRLAERHPDVWFVVDESYERLTYAPVVHRPVMAAWTPANIVAVRSFSKSYALPHLRVGWITASPAVSDRLRIVIEWQQLYGSSVSQRVALAVLGSDLGWLGSAFATFAGNRDLAVELFAQCAGLEVGRPAGGPFVYPVLPARRSPEPDYAALWRRGVPAVPGPYFGGAPNAFRLAFGGPEPVLHETIRQIAEWYGEQHRHD